MKDIYKQMIDGSDFAHEDLTFILGQAVENSEKGAGIYAHRETRHVEAYTVEGLAIIYGGLLNIFIDIPGEGRVTRANPVPPMPTPELIYLIASSTGHQIRNEKPHEDTPNLAHDNEDGRRLNFAAGLRE